MAEIGRNSALSPLSRRPRKSPRPEPPINLTATDYGERSPKAWDALLAPGWVLEGSFTMWEVAAFIREQKANYPNAKLFGVLEDISQAFYTSGHSLRSNELDDIDPETQDGLHADSFENFEPGDPAEFIGLTHPSEFPIRHKIFMDYVAQSEPTAWHNAMMWDVGDVRCPSLVAGTPRCPDLGGRYWQRDRKTYVTRVPVGTAAEAIAIFPNGYFSDDMAPDENYGLAKALEDNFGLEIFGFGATYAGYMRDKALSGEEAKALGAFLAPLYASEPADVSAQIAKIAEDQHTIFLSYGNR